MGGGRRRASPERGKRRVTHLIRHGFVAGTFALPIALALLGAVAALTGGPDYLLSVNSEGVPRAAPAAVSLALAAAALVAWRPGIPFRLLAIHWALGAVAFARPALRFHLPEGGRAWAEGVAQGAMLAAFAVALALVLLALAVRDARAVRLALGAAGVVWVAVLVTLSLPPNLTRYAAAYLVILAAGALACCAAQRERTTE